MISENRTERVELKRCRNCNRHSSAPVNFCRWCGSHQTESSVASTEPVDSFERKTTVLEDAEETPDSLSARSLNALKRSAARRTGPLRLNRFWALVIAVLIAIPMWLLIVLLSPFDAYVSAKAAWSEMNN